MKREFRKFFGRRSTVVFFYLLILSFCGLAVYLTTQVHRTNDLSDYLGEYNNPTELRALYDEERALLEENRASYEALGLDVQPLLDRQTVFAYVTENYIEASEAIVYSETAAMDGRDSLSVLFSLSSFLLPLLLLSAAVLTSMFFTADFSGNRHRFLYAGRNRFRIVLQKFGAYFTVICGLWGGMQLLSGAYNFLFSKHLSEVLIVSGGSVKALSMAGVWLLHVLCNLLLLLPLFLGFFLLGVLVRNEAAAGILQLLLFGLIFGTAYISEKAPLCLLGGNALDCYAYSDAPMSQWLLAYTAELAFVLLLGIAAFVCLRKADLG